MRVCVSGMADATGWHKCSEDGDTVGTKLCENCALFFVFFLAIFKHIFPTYSSYIPHIFLYIIYISICIYSLYNSI